MSEKAFLFIPDISGFTKFVNQTETSHSRHIISELLEIILESNTLSLSLAEVEGDALFMYREGPLPSATELLAQVKKMFIAFHEHLVLYKHKRICDCGACSTANSLTLKFVVHVAPIDFIEVQGIRKPYGPEIIQVHRLLKNEIENDEYLLLSEGANKVFDLSKTGFETTSYKSTYDFGDVNYGGIDISSFRADVPEFPNIAYSRSKTKIISTSLEINAPIADVYEFASNLRFKVLWNESLQKIDYDRGRVNQGGTVHQCIVGGKEIEFETMATSSEKRPLIYSERTKSIPFTEVVDSYFVFTETKNGTKMEVSVHADFKKNRGWTKGILKMMMVRDFKKGLPVFKNLLEEKGLDQLYLETAI